MLFNSIDFAVFLPIVFLLYWFVFNKNTKLQNLFLVIVSYLFYGWWDWRFLFLIIFSTFVDFQIGKLLALRSNPKERKNLLFISIFVNLGFLGFFKYFNFFVDNFREAFSFFGQEITTPSLNIILPVGISFYTFQTLSYTVDVYKGKLQPTSNAMKFAAFVSFFPQLVAGPIERALNLLPQFYKKRQFSYGFANDGIRQILWGFFKKIVIADNCAYFANEIFANYEGQSSLTLLLGAFFFAFQIYGDFSGYSDIAIGISRLFGFKLSKNFAFPYFSRDIAEFWRRWHISLSTWFRDYLYIPLGGSKGSRLLQIRNVFIIFIVSGFWHGANWTFIVWGAINAIYFLPLLLSDKNRAHINVVASQSKLPSLVDFFKIILTFSLTLLAWIFFRAENIQHAINYLIHLFSNGGLIEIKYFKDISMLLLLLFLFITVEWIGRRNEYALEKLFVGNKYKQLGFYSFLVFLMLNFVQLEETPFIYFQF